MLMDMFGDGSQVVAHDDDVDVDRCVNDDANIDYDDYYVILHK